MKVASMTNMVARFAVAVVSVLVVATWCVAQDPVKVFVEEVAFR